MDTFGFGLEASQGCVGLTTGDAALALGFCLGGDLDLCLGDFLACDFLSTEPLGLQGVLRTLDFSLSLPAGDFRTLEGFCLTLSEVGVGAGMSARATFSPSTACASCCWINTRRSASACF